MAAEQLGGFDRLTDMCCHVAVMMSKPISEEAIQQVISEGLLVAGHEQSSMQHTLLSKVVYRYATVLKYNFINNVLSDKGYSCNLNHIAVHGACHNYKDHLTKPQSISGELTATVYWHTGEINVH